MAVGTPILQSAQNGYEKGKVTQENEYLVKMSPADTLMDAQAAVLALGVPTGYYVDRIRPKVDIQKGPMWAKVEVTYAIPTWAGDGVPPLIRPSVLTSFYDERRVAYPFGYEDGGDGYMYETDQVVNTAKVPFDSPPLRDDDRLVLQITKNFATFPADAYDQLRSTTNADAVTIKGTTYGSTVLRMKHVTVQEVIEIINGIKYDYFATTFRIAVDRNLHVDKIDDRGWEDIHGKPAPPLCGKKPSHPVPLHLGEFKAAGSAPDILTFIPYPQMSWGLSFD